MVSARTVAWIALMAAGVFAGTVGADVVASDRLALGLASGGFAFAWGVLLLGSRWELGGAEDERFETIWYRSGFYGWLLAMAAATTLAATLSHRPDLLSAKYTAILIGTTGGLSVVIAAAYLERAM